MFVGIRWIVSLRSDYPWILFEFSSNSFMHDCYSFVFLLRSIDLVWPTRLIILQWEEVLCNGFNLSVIYILVTERDKTRICIVSIKDKKMGFIHAWVYFVYIMSSWLRRYSILYELNNLDTCWTAVKVWSNNSRCRQESLYLSRIWCLYTWSLP